MELLLIPVLLAAGLALTYLGANGVSTPQPVAESAPEPAPTTAYVAQERPRAPERQPAGRRSLLSAAPEPVASITQADVLLADVLTEMIELRGQFAELQRRVASLKTEVTQLSGAAERPRVRRNRVA